MSDLDELRELISRIQPPAYDDLVAVARTRRRRSAVAAATAATAAVVIVTALATQVGEPRGAPVDPIVPDPSVSASSSPTAPPSAPLPSGGPGRVTPRFAALTPEQIKAHPDAEVLKDPDNDVTVVGAPGVAARIWSVCLDVCRPGDDSTWVDGTLQMALEVTGDDYQTSAMYEYSRFANVSHAAGDRFVVTGAGTVLVDSSGRRDVLTQGETLPVTAIAGPLVFTGQPYAWLDFETLQLHGIEGSGGTWETEKAPDVWTWGNIYFVSDAGRITRQGLTWHNPDDSFGVRMLPIEFDGYSTQMLRAGTPGTMAAVDPTPPGLVHVSTDYGATWQVRVIPASVRRNSGGAIAESVLPDDWESWPTP